MSELPAPQPGTHFGVAGEHYEGFGSYHDEPGKLWVANLRHREAARSYVSHRRGWNHGYNAGYEDALFELSKDRDNWG